MSHSKYSKRGRSLYLENWNPAGRKYINICVMCCKQGYSPALDEADFCNDSQRRAICYAVKRAFPNPLPLDEWGRCAHCADLMNKTP